jgi:peptidoglycan/xylan/chitin deacetylase (PgdA/CDA1 family)
MKKLFTGYIVKHAQTAVKFLFYLAGRWLPVKGVVVFCYHSINDLDSIISLPVKKFQKQINYLKQKGFKALSADEFLSFQRKGSVPSGKWCLITFDDGFMDNYTNAFPKLHELDFPFVVFLATDYIGGKAGWAIRDLAEIFSVKDAEALKDRSTTELIDDFRNSDFVKRNMKFQLSCSDDHIRRFIAELKNLALMKMMTWDEVTEMAGSGVDFASHSCSHPYLADLHPEDILREVKESKELIDKVLKKRTLLFCYPYGIYSNYAKRIIAGQGFEASFGVELSVCRHFEDPLALSRVLISREQSMWEFKFLLCWGFNWYIGLRKLLKKFCRMGPKGLNSAYQGFSSRHR